MPKAIELGKLTKEEVSAALKREKSPSMRRRLTVIRLMQRRQHTAEAVARTVGVSRSVVFVWTRKCRTLGLAGLLQDEHGQGRKSAIKQRILEELKTGLGQGRWTNDQEILAWLRGQKVGITASGVRYWRRKLGFVRRRGRRPRHPQALSPVQKRDMLRLTIDEATLQEMEGVLSHYTTTHREMALQALLLLAARSMRLSGHADEGKYQRLLVLAARAKHAHTPGTSAEGIAKRYKTTGWSVAKIVEEVGCSRTSCYRWVKRLRLIPFEQFFVRFG